MILLPSVLRPHRFPFVLPLAALAVTTVFLTVATGALAQGRYRTPDEAVAALADAVRTDAPQQMMRVLGPGSEESCCPATLLTMRPCAGVSSPTSRPSMRSFRTARTRPR